MLKDSETTVEWFARIRLSDAKLDAQDLEALVGIGKPIEETRSVCAFLQCEENGFFDNTFGGKNEQFARAVNDLVEAWLRENEYQKFEYHLQDKNGLESLGVFDSFYDAMTFFEAEVGGAECRIIRVGQNFKPVCLTDWMRPDTMPMPNECPECERSNGPHYVGPCDHGRAS